MFICSIFWDWKKRVITVEKSTYKYDSYQHFKHSTFIPYIKQANDPPAVCETTEDKSPVFHQNVCNYLPINMAL
jgi:hypothetical protein